MAKVNDTDPHTAALGRALDPTDPRVILPEVPLECRRVLDLGCGAGQVLVTAGFDETTVRCGVDHNLAALRLGRSWDEDVAFIRSTGEDLPFPDECFDFVFSRNALPYMHLPSAFSEIARVLVPSGRLWMTLYPASDVWRDFVKSWRSGSLRKATFQAYRLANGLVYAATNRQFRFPAGRRRCESFQTSAGVSRALKQAGFVHVRVHKGKFFVVEAQRAG